MTRMMVAELVLPDRGESSSSCVTGLCAQFPLVPGRSPPAQRSGQRRLSRRATYHTPPACA